MGLVLLVRHGQASFGAEDYDVLSDKGVEQSRILGRDLAAQGLSPSAVVHGGMRRHRDTVVEMVAAARWAVLAEQDEGWDEFDHLAVMARGPDEPDLRRRALDRREFQRLFESATARWSGGAHDGEYVEPWPAFLARAGAALDRAFCRSGPTVVVSSGGPIAAACASLVDPAATPEQLTRLWTAFNTVNTNASLTRVLEGSTGRRLLTFNEHSHLPGDLVTYR